MRQIKKLRSSSLVVTVVISLILSIFCSSLILLAYYNRQSQKIADIETRINNNVKSAINLVLADSSIYDRPHIDTIDLFNDEKDSVIIVRKLWGIFEVAEIKVFYGKFSKKKIFFYGNAMSDDLNGCLYLADHQRPLSLVGETKLIGDVYISRSGIKTSYINQRSFSYNRLLEGKIKTSDEFLPPLQDATMNNLNTFFLQCNNKIIDQKIDERTNNDSISIDFTDSALVISKNGRLRLENCNLSGQIIILSDNGIEVNESASLKNVILVAPSIIFKKGFKGTAQAIASDSLIVENECVFDYPSSLILIKHEVQTIQNRLAIGENCKFTGNVISICKKDDRYKSYVEIKRGTSINGIVYTMGYLNLQTGINGTVMTDFFIYRTPTTIYENHLVDVELNRMKLSDFFLVPSIFRESGKRGIIQWVN